ncbi:hypothetical protein K402DRAFT_389818 [Aulographum hederae CBS 113979]|uniref:Uncharacterized protein n=1 Tax=Aulographum hederae CBS 113979 TaxID=1176131 RepID=A0A6G1HCG2_9PEZI|nr:hypothetical protein K402DRAFT_389818 [Aulographum hederae CBS 113979]
MLMGKFFFEDSKFVPEIVVLPCPCEHSEEHFVAFLFMIGSPEIYYGDLNVDCKHHGPNGECPTEQEAMDRLLQQSRREAADWMFWSRNRIRVEGAAEEVEANEAAK